IPSLQPSPPAKEPGWACPLVTTLSSNNIRVLLKSTHSPANSPISGLFCRVTYKLNALFDGSDRGRRDCRSPPSMSAIGTLRHFAASQDVCRFRTEADMKPAGHIGHIGRE